MLTIADSVEKIINDSPYLEEALRSGLINLSSLARHIQTEVEGRTKKTVKTGAIIMALKRLSSSIKKKNTQLTELFSNLGDMTVRSNLVEYTFANSDSLIDKQRHLYHSLQDSKEIFFNVSTGVYETTVIISKRAEKELQKVFKDEKLTSRFDNLSSITIMLPPDNVTIPGIYYTILKFLAWRNINLIEAFSTANEMTLFFTEENIEKAFAVLKGIKSEIRQ